MAHTSKKILTLVLSENKFLNETKNHNPPFKLNGRSLIGIDWPSKLNKHTKEIAAFHLIIKSKYEKYVRYYKIQSKYNIFFASLRELFSLPWTK